MCFNMNSWLFSLVQAPFINKEEVGFMTDTAAIQQGLWLWMYTNVILQSIVVQHKPI